MLRFLFFFSFIIFFQNQVLAENSISTGSHVYSLESDVLGVAMRVSGKTQESHNWMALRYFFNPKIRAGIDMGSADPSVSGYSIGTSLDSQRVFQNEYGLNYGFCLAGYDQNSWRWTLNYGRIDRVFESGLFGDNHISGTYTGVDFGYQWVMSLGYLALDLSTRNYSADNKVTYVSNNLESSFSVANNILMARIIVGIVL